MLHREATEYSKAYTPTVLGTGLVALDVVVSEANEDAPDYWAGGTCGNVLIILSYLGWRSSPVSRFGEDAATAKILADLKAWHVSTRFIDVGQDGSTPIIIHRIAKSSTGEPYHSFSWRCPACGARLPGYKAVLASTAETMKEHLGEPQVFFFDRVSRGALILARACSDRGALVVFEPASVGEPRLFREAWSIAHIVKYSHERLRDIADLELTYSDRENVLLEIETLGGDGLRFRSWLPECKSTKWQQLRSFKSESVKDTAGAGDWCTAGILDRLARSGLDGLQAIRTEQLQEAIRYGQALAVWNCGFEGARGGMYRVDKQTFEQQVATILREEEAPDMAPTAKYTPQRNFLKSVCPECKVNVNQIAKKRRNGIKSDVRKAD